MKKLLLTAAVSAGLLCSTGCTISLSPRDDDSVCCCHRRSHTERRDDRETVRTVREPKPSVFSNDKD